MGDQAEKITTIGDIIKTDSGVKSRLKTADGSMVTSFLIKSGEQYAFFWIAKTDMSWHALTNTKATCGMLCAYQREYFSPYVTSETRKLSPFKKISLAIHECQIAALNLTWYLNDGTEKHMSFNGENVFEGSPYSDL